VSGLAEFLNTLHWTVSNTCNKVASDVHVTVYGFTGADAGPDRHVFYSPIDGYILADTLAVGTGGTGTYTYVWSPSTNLDNPTTAHPLFSTPDSGTYTYAVTVTDGHGCTASDTVTYFVGKSTVLVVPTLFTPNGDGVNDELYIPGIESYPNNELTVVDRNDQVVFNQKNYKNDWKGINVQGFSQVGSQLPADTYYYTLKLEDGLGLQKGYFLIKY
jgi:gliding motility-associated-like protein